MTIHRDPHMHKLGDQVTVLVLPEGASDWSPTAMDMLGVFSPAAFISPTKLGPMEFHPHGLPVGNDIRIAPIPNAGATEGC